MALGRDLQIRCFQTCSDDLGSAEEFGPLGTRTREPNYGILYSIPEFDEVVMIRRLFSLAARGFLLAWLLVLGCFWPPNERERAGDEAVEDNLEAEVWLNASPRSLKGL